MGHTNKKDPAPTKTQGSFKTIYNAIFSPISPESKEFSEVANKFASRGHDLSRIDDEPPRYYVSRHGRALLVHSWMAVKTLLVHIVRSA